MAMMSAADTVIIPMQDILGLDERARMNRPATVSGNWEWRYSLDRLKPSIAEKLKDMTELYGRD